MFSQLLGLIIRHVLTWVFTAFVGRFSLHVLPSWHGLSDAYEPNRTIVSIQLLFETRPTIGVCCFHSLTNEIQI
jgi:hypothetical protein